MYQPKIYGYVRISTPKQNIERQVWNILQVFPTAIIIRETYTGTTMSGRKELDKLIKKLRPGDTVVFDEASRMSRTELEGCELYEQLFRMGVNLVFLKQPHINTDTYKKAMEKPIKVHLESGNDTADKLVNGMIEVLNECMLELAKDQVRYAFRQAEEEVEFLRKRTRDGIEQARRDGKSIGVQPGTKRDLKKAKEAKILIRKYSKSFDGSLENEHVMKIAGISRNTFYKYRRELIEEIAAELERAGA